MIATLLVTGVFLFGKSSKLLMSLKNPSYTGQKKSHRVLALALISKTGVRADFEGALAAELTGQGCEAIPGNTILLRSPGTQLDLNCLKERKEETP